MKHKIKFYLLLLTSLLVLSCATGSIDQSNIYEQEILSKIKSWKIELRYTSVVIEEEVNGEKTVKEGNLTHDIQFVDDLFFSIKNDDMLNLDKNEYEGIISLNIVRPNSFIDTIDIQLFDLNENVLARSKVSSGVKLMTNEEALPIVLDAIKNMMNIE